MMIMPINLRIRMIFGYVETGVRRLALTRGGFSDCAIVVAEEDVRAVGLGEARRALEEFLGIHDLSNESRVSSDAGICLYVPTPMPL